MPPPHTFHGKKIYRPGVAIVVAIATLFFGGIILGVFGAPSAVTTTLVMAGALISWIAVIAMSTERAMTIAVVDGALVTSWRRTPFASQEVRIGAWVQAASHTRIGLVAYVRGPSGSMRIGAGDHNGSGYVLDGPRSQYVDGIVSAADFDTLVAALGSRRSPAQTDLVFELVERRGMVRTIGPWFLAMACASMVGLALIKLGASRTVATAAILAITITGLCVTMLASWRIREPTRELRAGPDGLTLAAINRGPELAQALWPDIRAVRTRHVVRTKTRSYIHPSIELGLGASLAIVIGAMDQSLAWPSEKAKRSRTPRWLMSSADWRHLVDALETHGCFRL
jgi:hypothetical protein